MAYITEHLVQVLHFLIYYNGDFDIYVYGNR